MTTLPAEEVATAPELFVPDVDRAVDYFTNTLGFQVHRVEKNVDGRGTFAVIWLEKSVVLIADETFAPGAAARDGEPRGKAVDIRIMVPDVDATYERVKRSGADVVHDIADRDYGLRDFIVQDPLGFRWRFAAPVSGA